MKSKRILSAGCLILAAVIWGLAFVAQDKIADTVPPFTTNAVRSFIAAAALIPVAWFMRRSRGEKLLESSPADRKTLLRASVICGIFLAVSVNFQQFGISMYPDSAATSGRTGFITALYIVFVPIYGLFFKKKPGFTVVIAVALAVVGLYFLCLSNGIDSLYAGDLVVLGCAASFAVQIICVDRFIDRVDGVKLSSLQFFVCGVISVLLTAIFEKPSWTAVLGAAWPLLYLALMSSAVGYTLQIIGQKYSQSPAVASILMSLESVFAAVGGAIFMQERLLPRELFGCAVMFAAIILAQLPIGSFKRKTNV